MFDCDTVHRIGFCSIHVLNSLQPRMARVGKCAVAGARGSFQVLYHQDPDSMFMGHGAAGEHDGDDQAPFQVQNDVRIEKTHMYRILMIGVPFYSIFH